MTRSKWVWLVVAAMCVQLVSAGVSPSRADAADAAAGQSPVTQIVRIDPEFRHQTMDGWGTDLAWWAGQVGTWSDTVRTQLMDLIFGDDGLDLNIVRYNIGGSDDPATTKMHPARRMDTLATGVDENGNLQFDWSRDAGQRWVLKEAVTNPDYDVNLYDAQVNSPPYWMTISGSGAGNVSGTVENLAPENYDLYVDFLIEVLKHFETEGIPFQHIEPFNEPVSGYWKKGGAQEGAYFSREVQAILINKLKAKLDEAGLSTLIAASDETSIDQAIDTYKSFDAATRANISQMNTHVYSGSKRHQLRDLALGEGKPLWMSEISTGYVAHDVDGMAPAIPLGKIIFKDIKDMGVNAWIIWQAVEDEVENFVNLNVGSDYGKPWNPPGSWGLIHAAYSTMTDTEGRTFTKEDYHVTKQYYVMQQFSKFIKSGYTIIDANHDQVVAAVGPDGKLVIVAANFTDTPANFAMDIGKFDGHDPVAQAYRTSDTLAGERIEDVSLGGGSMLNVELPANSLTTYVIDHAEYDGPLSKNINDNVIGTVDNAIGYSGHWSYYDAQSGAYSNDVHYSGTAGDSLTLRFVGNRAKLYGARSADSGIASISVDGGEPVDVDLYAASRQDDELIFDSGLLAADGEHVLTLNVTGAHHPTSTNNYIAFDRAVATSGDTGDRGQSPQFELVAAQDAAVKLIYGKVPGAAEYRIHYGTQSGKYPYTVISQGTSAVIPGLENGTAYYFTVTAVVNGVETEASGEVAATPVHVPQSGLAYYVDAGAIGLPEGATLGDYNGVVDQAFGTDPVTGRSWGWISPSGTGEYNAGDRFRTVRYAAATTTGGLSYQFELPNGKYNVSLGFSDPWGNTSRKVDIRLQNETVTGNYVAPAYPNTDVQSYSAVQVDDGMLRLDVWRTAANTTPYTDALISWIRIERYDAELAPGAPYITGVEPMGTNEAKVTFIEGTGADYYKVKYGTEPQSPAHEVTVEDGLAQVIRGLAADTTYYFTVTGYNAFGEGVSSNEATATTLSADPGEAARDGLMYYTVLGASGFPNGTANGFLQGSDRIDPTDYPAPDPATGYAWGMTNRGDLDGAWVVGPYGGFGYTNNKTAGEGLDYSFEVPNGTYEVSLGFYDPWGVGNREMDIRMEGTTVGTANALTSGTQVYSDIEVTDGALNVSVVNPTPTHNVAPGFSMIQVKLKQGLAVDKKSVTLTAGETGQLRAVALPDNGGSGDELIWQSSNPAVVTVEGGTLTAMQAGTADITVTSATYGELSATSAVTVLPGVVTATGVTVDATTITKRKPTTVTATVVPSDAPDRALVWTTDNPAVATVTPGEGGTAVVAPVGAGTAKIRVASASAPHIFATIRVNIPLPVEAVRLNADIVTLARGEKARLTPVVQPASAAGTKAVWRSSNPGVARANANGVVSTGVEGTATITATIGGVSASADIIVTGKAVPPSCDRGHSQRPCRS